MGPGLGFKKIGPLRILGDVFFVENDIILCTYI